MARKKQASKTSKVCISLEAETKNKLKAMGSKGDTYDDVINGIIDLLPLISNPEVAAAVARDCKMSEEFIEQLKEFNKSLVKRGATYRNCDYEAQKLLLRLDLLT